jgi:hypothetical protein
VIPNIWVGGIFTSLFNIFTLFSKIIKFKSVLVSLLWLFFGFFGAFRQFSQKNQKKIARPPWRGTHVCPTVHMYVMMGKQETPSKLFSGHFYDGGRGSHVDSSGSDHNYPSRLIMFNFYHHGGKDL